MTDHASPSTSPAPARKAVRAIGPRLRWLFTIVLVAISLLMANSAYLVTITFLQWKWQETFENYFYHCMFLAHLVLGLLLIVPFLVFSLIHMWNTHDRKNRRAVLVGYGLFGVSLILLLSGLLLFRVDGFEIKHPGTRSAAYWAHVISPLFAIWLYVLHRLSGPRIKWKIGATYLTLVGVCVAALAALHSQDPRQWNVAGPASGEQYFHPSRARTVSGDFIPAETLMMDEYCRECHADAHKGWLQSAHRFSS
ncbi:MAG: hypothetical protein KDA58_11505, partial [Planctomycetaceae bacterium]|nr:hypothetical protein [Planctomycetaceae bacterium]